MHKCSVQGRGVERAELASHGAERLDCNSEEGHAWTIDPFSRPTPLCSVLRDWSWKSRSCRTDSAGRVVSAPLDSVLSRGTGSACLSSVCAVGGPHCHAGPPAACRWGPPPRSCPGFWVSAPARATSPWRAKRASAAGPLGELALRYLIELSGVSNAEVLGQLPWQLQRSLLGHHALDRLFALALASNASTLL